MIRFSMLILLTLTAFAYADDPDFGLDVDEEYVEGATIVTGKIRSIDLSSRTVEISGFRYQFETTGMDRVMVKLVGRDFGAVELLRPGMFVEVYFIQEPDRRVAKLMLQQETGEEF